MKLAGSCHCGRIAFEVDAGDGIAEVYDCNCSMCRRRGGLLWFAPREAFALSTPRDELATYTFHKHVLEHHFCPTCGIATFGEGIDPRSGAPMAAVNVRCLDGVDLATLPVMPYDGASR